MAAVGPAACRRLTEPAARVNVARNLRLHGDAGRPADARPAGDACADGPGTDADRSAGRDIRLGPSLWALTGSPPPGEDTWARIAEQEDLP